MEEIEEVVKDLSHKKVSILDVFTGGVYQP